MMVQSNSSAMSRVSIPDRDFSGLRVFSLKFYPMINLAEVSIPDRDFSGLRVRKFSFTPYKIASFNP